MLGQIIRHWGKLLVVAGVLIGVVAVGATIPTTVEADSSVQMQRFSDESEIDGTSSKLKRNGNGVTMNIKTTELDPGAAYTVWWVVFNNPDNCDSPCDGQDIDDCAPPDGPNTCGSLGISVLWATGHVVGNNGKGNFSGHLKENDPPGQVLFGPGLTDAENAEIHLVVRTHGQPIPGKVDEQISTFGGGCTQDTGGDLSEEEGNACADEQFAIHQP